MKVGLLGGTFDPPHMGHVLIAQQVLDFAGVEEVWFLPNYQQDPPKPSSPVEDRVAMVNLIKMPKTKVSQIEIEHKLDGITYHLLPYVPKDHDFVFIIGSDQLPTFHLWTEWQELVRRMPFLVFPRYEYPSEPLYENMRTVSEPSLVTSNISSTKVRDRVKLGLSIENFVPPGVAEYIKEHKLYL
jgi:nicotinate-nucleotide adenylyltransferase